MAQGSKKPLIPHRVLLIGDEQIPREVLEGLKDHQLQAFMREPDPTKWPPQMEHLLQYLSVEERFRAAVSTVLAGHDHLLAGSLEEWALSAWKELTELRGVAQEDLRLLLDEMANHLKGLLSEFFEGG